MVVFFKTSKESVAAGGADYLFECPACGCYHGVWTTKRNKSNAVWQFNGDLEKPTVSPSLRIHYHDSKSNKDVLCHFYIKNGNIEYLNDCTHQLKGDTIKIPTIA